MSANSLTDARKSSFAPFVAPQTRLLVLGTLPGEESLRTQRYYAHPRNLFWHLIGTAIGQDIASLDYEHRVAALRDARVGLVGHDRLGPAHRQPRHRDPGGGAQSAGRAGRQPARTARGCLQRCDLGEDRHASCLPEPSVALVALPSSSPAHAAMKLADKEAIWRELAKFLALNPCQPRPAHH